MLNIQFRPRCYENRGRRRSQGRGWKTPDYKLHPERWTEYSLEDVDVSDSTNKLAAFAFLQERRAMKDSEMKEESADLDSIACSKGAITFKKPVKKSNKSESETVGSESNQKIVQRNDLLEGNGDNDNNNDIAMDETEETVSDVQRNLKRKLDLGENDSEMKEQSESAVGFKSRKIARKNIRSRPRSDDNDSD